MLGGLLFSVMDTTIVSTALVSIASDLKDFPNMYWVVLAYLLSYLGKTLLSIEEKTSRRWTDDSIAGCAIGFAKLADHFGRLPIFLLSWMIFSSFSLGCGFATTMPQL